MGLTQSSVLGGCADSCFCFVRKGKCWDCTKGSDKHCRNYEGLVGLTVDGAFADFTLVDARSAVALPHSMTWDQVRCSTYHCRAPQFNFSTGFSRLRL